MSSFEHCCCSLVMHEGLQVVKITHSLTVMTIYQLTLNMCCSLKSLATVQVPGEEPQNARIQVCLSGCSIYKVEVTIAREQEPLRRNWELPCKDVNVLGGS